MSKGIWNVDGITTSISLFFMLLLVIILLIILFYYDIVQKVQHKKIEKTFKK